MEKYPEHQKLDSKQLETIDSFFEFLEERGFSVVDISQVGHFQGKMKHGKRDDLRVEFFGTTQAKLEPERIEMLNELQWE